MHCGFVKMLFSTFYPCLPTQPRGLIDERQQINGLREKSECAQFTSSTSPPLMQDPFLCRVTTEYICRSVPIQGIFVPLIRRRENSVLQVLSESERNALDRSTFHFLLRVLPNVNLPAALADSQSCRCGLLAFFSASLMASGVPVKTHTKAD